MVEEKKYTQILGDGLMLDHYFILCSIKDGKALTKSKRVQGFINLLTKKEYILDDHLTDKALLLLGEDISKREEEVKEEVKEVKVEPVKAVAKNRSLAEHLSYMNYPVWVKDLHEKCQNKLIELTGNKQVMAKITRKAYPFLPNCTDLSKILSKVISVYKLTDFDKIERTLLLHIENCQKSGNWFPIMQYYIWKNNLSQMVTDLDNDEDQDQGGYKSNQKFI